METAEKYNVRWDCPKCGNSHNWWWEHEFEACTTDTLDLVCDKCESRVKCTGDGTGYYEAVKAKEVKEAKVIKTLFDGVNALSKRLTDVELAVRRLENDIKVPGNAKLGPQHIEYAKEKEKSFMELIHGVKSPFHARLREGCQFTKEELPPEKLAAVLRFIAVEVQRMTERDMGGSFTVSNLEVARQLRELAADASVEDYIYDPDHKDSDDIP
jgi:hypothetical protein